MAVAVGIAAWFVGLCAAPAGDADSATVVRGVVVSGPGASRMESPAQALRGSRFDSASVRKSLTEVVDSAVAQGFLSATATAKSAVMTDSGTTILVETDAGGRLVWERLVDVGASRTTPSTLQRIGRIPTGRSADPADLESAMRRLAQTGYVEAVAPPTIRRLPRSARARGELRLRDVPASYVEAAAGWTRADDVKGYLETRLANISGTARDLEFGLTQGEQGILAHALWKEPWLGPLDARLVLKGNLANDTLAQVFTGSMDLVWSLLDGRMEVGGGLSVARRLERDPGDTAFGPTSTEFGSRLVFGWRRHPPSAWPVDDFSTTLDAEVATTNSDTGSGARLRSRWGGDAWLGAAPFVFRIGGQARGIWPLDRTAGLSEAIAPGGIAGWRGWPEGSPRSPSWAWLVAQAGIGAADKGGVFLFWEPGVRALRRQDLTWAPSWNWSAGAGLSALLPSWQIDLVVAGRDETATWQDALVQVRARNRF